MTTAQLQSASAVQWAGTHCWKLGSFDLESNYKRLEMHMPVAHPETECNLKLCLFLDTL